MLGDTHWSDLLRSWRAAEHHVSLGLDRKRYVALVSEHPSQCAITLFESHRKACGPLIFEGEEMDGAAGLDGWDRNAQIVATRHDDEQDGRPGSEVDA